MHKQQHKIYEKLDNHDDPNVSGKKAYVCHIEGCIHNLPECALSDITAIRKHYARKHEGGNTWRCDCECSYVVEFDFKAHRKSCGKTLPQGLSRPLPSPPPMVLT
ncbi:hypothetical protein QYE76_039998 [Lolium multiflorum]|uniref:BIRD-IDD transcription factor second C2H2 zinc finger domain-containing protein n=1 Tax=Lolium multiflorum TaxID=4521 RepID=A0AAD8TAY8_LOLMU|nr:hypothetical protein QYE76_039998 [Lolium multiflorum]